MSLLPPVRSTQLLAACIGVAASAASLVAQETAASTVSWEIGAASAGWCIDFLVAPKVALNDLTRGQRVVLARDVRGVPLPLQQTIADEPQYAEWVPSELCTYFVDAIWVGGRRFDKGDGGKPLAFLYWGVAAAGTEDAMSTGVSLRVLGTNSSGLTRAMEIQKVPIDRVHIDRKPIRDSGDQEYLIKLEGATISFAGSLTPDSNTTPVERQRKAVVNGDNRSVWKVEFRYAPIGISHLSGALRIVGKRRLADALNDSPIRLLGPSVVGGRGKLEFTK